MIRDPFKAGAIGSVIIVGVLAAVIGIPQLMLRSETSVYSADFTNAAGLASGDAVDVAGVPAGKVTDVALSGNQVRVTFRLTNGQKLGTASTAAIKLATILGTRYLSVHPSGQGALRAGAVIPAQRTTNPISLTDLGTQVGNDTSKLNMSDITRLVSTLGKDLPKNPALVKGALAGVTSATGLLSQDNAKFDQLLKSTRTVTSGLLNQQKDLVTLLGDGQLVLSTLTERRSAIASLINDLDSMSAQLTRFLSDNKTELDSVLSEVSTLTGALREDEDDLSTAIRRLGPGTVGLANATGNGPWGDVEGPAGPIPDNLLCLSGLVSGCS